MTGSQLVRKFVIRVRPDWDRFMAFISSNLKEITDRGDALQIVVSIYRATRSNEANAFMWAGLLTPIAEQAWIGGVQYKPAVWAEFYKELFLPDVNAKGMDKWMLIPSGNRRLMMGSSDLNTAEMTLYLEQISAHATGELGVLLPANPNTL